MSTREIIDKDVKRGGNSIDGPTPVILGRKKEVNIRV